MHDCGELIGPVADEERELGGAGGEIHYEVWVG